MPLQPGAFLGPYELVSALGAGGMGEVYRARDAKLNRDVAIKVLPAIFAADRERLARFKREAQVLASLNHTNIAAIYGFEESTGTPALVLELVEGPTLADCIAQGPIPLEDALSIARQICDALETAHGQGIIHRDLKPANIKVRPDGTVKILDFGLARVLEPAGIGATGGELANTPTITSPAMMTGIGVLLGTAAYMSPEQAKGHPADKRSDIWAFGCVLYEMLTGTRAFGGDDVAETLAAVLKSTPDWNVLPASVPASVRVLLEGCLAKDRRQRFGDIAVARFLLNMPALTDAPAVVAARQSRWMPALALAAVLALLVLIATLWRPSPPPGPVVRLEVTLPPGQQPTALNRRAIAISRDGEAIAYIANRQLFVRSMAEGEARPLAGAVNIANPTFSPDGQSLAFWSAGDATLKRVALGSGAIATICDSPSNPLGISWGDDGVLFAEPEGIFRVPAAGGRPELLIPTPPLSRPARAVLSNPQSLTSDTVLFTMAMTGPEATPKWQIAVQSLKSSRRTILIDGGADAHYLPAGYLIYAAGGTLFATGFDVKRLAVTGRAVPVVEGVLRFSGAVAAALAVESAQFAVSQTGVLLFIPGPAGAVNETLALFDRNSQRLEPLKVDSAMYNFPRVSPDGQRLAVQRRDGNEENIYIYDLSGASAMERLTFGGSNRYPVWSADGRRVAFQSDRDGDRAIFEQAANGGRAERITKPEPGASHMPQSWSPDGSVLLFDVLKAGASSLWMFSVPDRRTAPFDNNHTEEVPSDVVFSPDGHWVAYQAGTYQRDYTLVEPFPPNATKFQIGVGGRPLWSRDGNELYYIPAPAQFVAVGVKTTPTFAFTTAAPVPRAFGLADPMLPRPFDVMKDGRFVVIVPATGQTSAGEIAPTQIHVVLNWLEELKQRVQR